MKIRPSRIREDLLWIIVVCVVSAGSNLSRAQAQAPDIAALHKQAEAGNADAQYKLAAAYLNGEGVARDGKQGVEWLQKAAKLDHPGAQLALSTFFLRGGGQNIPKDPKQGLLWLEKAANHGYAPAEYNLGLLYQDGDGGTGIPRDPHKAATLFRKAARQPGSTKSQAALQDMLQKKLISRQEANWQAAEPVKVAEKGKAAPFSLGDVETGLKGRITSARMATLVQHYGVDFKLNDSARKRLKDDGAEDALLQMISISRRSL